MIVRFFYFIQVIIDVLTMHIKTQFRSKPEDCIYALYTVCYFNVL